MSRQPKKGALTVAEDGNLEDLSEFQEVEKTGREIIPEKKKRQVGSVVIKKMKLVKKEFITLSYSRIEADGSTTNVNEDHKAPVHNDLKSKFQSLSVHLALLCDYLSTRQIKDINAYDPELVSNFFVTGVSIGGNDDDEGIVLTGYKITRSDKAVILNTPFARIEEVQETKYRYMDDLTGKVDELQKEIELYLGGKRGPDPQGSLEFPEDEPFVEEGL